MLEQNNYVPVLVDSRWLKKIISLPIAEVLSSTIPDADLNKLAARLSYVIERGMKEQFVDPLLDTRQSAAYLKSTHRFLQEGRLKGSGPRFIRVSRSIVRYRLSDINDWLALRVKSSTSED